MIIRIKANTTCSCGAKLPSSITLTPAGMVATFLAMPGVNLKEYFSSAAAVCSACGAMCALGEATVER